MPKIFLKDLFEYAINYIYNFSFFVIAFRKLVGKSFPEELFQFSTVFSQSTSVNLSKITSLTTLNFGWNFFCDNLFWGGSRTLFTSKKGLFNLQWGVTFSALYFFKTNHETRIRCWKKIAWSKVQNLKQFLLL